MKHITAFCSVIIIFIISLFFSLTVKAEHKQKDYPPVPVVTQSVIEKQFNEAITFVGTVKPDQRSLTATEISGLVKEMLYKEGDFVKEGAVLARLKPDSLKIQLKEAKAALNEGLARLDYAESRKERFKDLYEKTVVSIEELQEAEADRDAWDEKAVQYKMKIDRLQYDINQMEIKAPFNGYIISKYTEIGEWLVTGSAVYELINPDSIYVLVNVPEHIAVTLNRNDPAGLTFDAFPDLKVDGNILSIIPHSSEKARTLPVKIGFKNEDKEIKSGLLARVSFFIGKSTVSKLVPKDAIVEMNNQKFVYIVNNGIASPLPVTIGLAHEDLVEVFGGVTADMQIIVRGNERVRPGQSVMIQNAQH